MDFLSGNMMMSFIIYPSVHWTVSLLLVSCLMFNDFQEKHSKGISYKNGTCKALPLSFQISKLSLTAQNWEQLMTCPKKWQRSIKCFSLNTQKHDYSSVSICTAWNFSETLPLWPLFWRCSSLSLFFFFSRELHSLGEGYQLAFPCSF